MNAVQNLMTALATLQQIQAETDAKRQRRSSRSGWTSRTPPRWAAPPASSPASSPPPGSFVSRRRGEPLDVAGGQRTGRNQPARRARAGQHEDRPMRLDAVELGDQFEWVDEFTWMR
ncbi:hypothetical protein P4110_00020 [Pseudomonas aeruginosa]|nr:hypothetical protein [Pseudomonas aeruginosa]